MVNRNFTKIASLSPGLVAGVFNAGELRLGGTALSQIAKSNDGIYVHGARSYDNNWQLDGIGVSDVQGSAGASGGIPIPNPHALQEFKLQTGLFDAALRRDDYRISRLLTLNLGLRYERLGQIGDNLSRNSSFDVTKADANPTL
jgi:hypothetical protein